MTILFEGIDFSGYKVTLKGNITKQSVPKFMSLEVGPFSKLSVFDDKDYLLFNIVNGSSRIAKVENIQLLANSNSINFNVIENVKVSLESFFINTEDAKLICNNKVVRIPCQLSNSIIILIVICVVIFLYFVIWVSLKTANKNKSFIIEQA